MGKKFRLRYRIDGVLHEVESPPRKLQSAIISRVKIMSNMSIAEKRVPQDGRIEINVMGRDLDLRVSTIPTNHGESVVMRILDKESLALGLGRPRDRGSRRIADRVGSRGIAQDRVGSRGSRGSRGIAWDRVGSRGIAWDRVRSCRLIAQESAIYTT